MKNQNLRSKIIITSEFVNLKNELVAEFNERNLRFVPEFSEESDLKDFLIEDAKNVEKQSYIAEKEPKIIVIFANSFRAEAQNFLLKLLEEPPTNISFIIACKSKNLLLPTIRSRLICEKRKQNKSRKALELSLQNLDLKQILSFLQQNEGIEKNELGELIAALGIASSKLDLSEEKLELFYKAYELANLNASSNTLLSALLLNLYRK